MTNCHTNHTVVRILSLRVPLGVIFVIAIPEGAWQSPLPHSVKGATRKRLLRRADALLAMTACWVDALLTKTDCHASHTVAKSVIASPEGVWQSPAP